MKLNSDQINYIDQTLEANGIIYDDIKIELIDHIATDIETEMNTKKLPFEAVYEDCFNKMKPVLYKKNKLPLIIEQKVYSEFRKASFKSIIFAIIFSLFLIWVTNDVKSIFESTIFNAIIYTLLIAYFSLHVIFKYRFYRNSYNEILIKSIETILLFASLFFLDTLKIISNVKDTKMFLILGWYFYNISFLMQMTYKSIQIITKLNQQKYETK